MRIVSILMLEIGRRLKGIATLGVGFFIIMSTYSMGMERYGALTIFAGLFLWPALVLIIIFVPFGLALSPVMFELWLRETTLWDVSTLAWAATGMMLLAHGTIGLGRYLDQKI